jgi:cation transporter-like permease
MMTRNWLVAIVILLAFALPMFAGSASEAGAPAPAARTAKEFHIALILKSLSNPAIWNIADAAEKPRWASGSPSCRAWVSLL